MNKNSHSKPIKDMISFIRLRIQSKEETVMCFQKKYLTTSDDIIVINRFALIELLDEFQGIINQSLQAIEILQTEMLNLEEQSTIEKQNSIDNAKDNQCQKENNIYQRPKGIKQTFTTKKNNNAKLNSSDTNPNLIITNTNQPPKQSNSSNSCNLKEPETKSQPKSSSIIEATGLLYSEQEPEPEQEKIRTPLIHPGIISAKNIFRQSELNANYNIDLISTEMEYTPIPSRSKVLQSKINQMDKDNKMKGIITKIGNIERYKSYLATKYGNGNYKLFIEKLNSNKINSEELAQEVKMISQEMKNNINKYKAKTLNKTSRIKENNNDENTITPTTIATASSKSSRHNKRIKTRIRSESAKRQINQLNEQILHTYRQIDGL